MASVAKIQKQPLKKALKASFMANIRRTYFRPGITSKSYSDLIEYCLAQGLTEIQASDIVREITYTISFLFSVNDDFEIVHWIQMLTNIMRIDAHCPDDEEIDRSCVFKNCYYDAVLCFYHGLYDGKDGEFFLNSILNACHFIGCKSILKDVAKRIARVMVPEIACVIYQMIPACYFPYVNKSLRSYYDKQMVNHSPIVLYKSPGHSTFNTPALYARSPAAFSGNRVAKHVQFSLESKK